MITIYTYPSLTVSYLMTKPLGHYNWDGRLEAPLGATGFECPW